MEPRGFNQRAPPGRVRHLTSIWTWARLRWNARKPARVWIVCAPEDKEHLDALTRQLAPWVRTGKVVLCEQREAETLEQALERTAPNRALWLVSAHLLSNAAALAELGLTATFQPVPIIVRSCLWNGEPLLAEALPRVMPAGSKVEDTVPPRGPEFWTGVALDLWGTPPLLPRHARRVLVYGLLLAVLRIVTGFLWGSPAVYPVQVIRPVEHFFAASATYNTWCEGLQNVNRSSPPCLTVFPGYLGLLLGAPTRDDVVTAMEQNNMPFLIEVGPHAIDGSPPADALLHVLRQSDLRDLVDGAELKTPTRADLDSVASALSEEARMIRDEGATGLSQEVPYPEAGGVVITALASLVRDQKGMPPGQREKEALERARGFCVGANPPQPPMLCCLVNYLSGQRAANEKERRPADDPACVAAAASLAVAADRRNCFDALAKRREVGNDGLAGLRDEHRKLGVELERHFLTYASKMGPQLAVAACADHLLTDSVGVQRAVRIWATAEPEEAFRRAPISIQPSEVDMAFQLADRGTVRLWTEDWEGAVLDFDGCAKKLRASALPDQVPMCVLNASAARLHLRDKASWEKVIQDVRPIQVPAVAAVEGTFLRLLAEDKLKKKPAFEDLAAQYERLKSADRVVGEKGITDPTGTIRSLVCTDSNEQPWCKMYEALIRDKGGDSPSEFRRAYESAAKQQSVK